MRSGKPAATIIGGGLGGLAAALALRRAGFVVDVYEQAEGNSEAGAGIQIGPNASRVLARIAPDVARTGRAVRPATVHQRRWDDGRTLQRIPLGEAAEAAFGAPYYNFHRADLLHGMAGAFPEERIHFRHRLTAVRDLGELVEARFENGVSIAADILVCADGIHSTARGLLFGPTEPRFTGCIAYRGLVPSARLSALGLEVVSSVWLGPGAHFVHYFVAGGEYVNFVAVVERESWTGESWTDRGDKADLLRALSGWHGQPRAIIEAADETFVWALFDRWPMTHWSAGRATLLGDACHAMLPFMGQGAGQALEDAATLAACLERFGIGSAPEALRRYETLRLPRATRLQELSRFNKKLFHLPDGEAQQARDAMFAAQGRSLLKAMAWLYAHDASLIDGN
jgi:salicylate hydroxylase